MAWQRPAEYPSSLSPRVEQWLAGNRLPASTAWEDLRALRADQRNIAGDFRRAIIKLLAEELRRHDG